MTNSEAAAALRKISEGIWDLAAAIETGAPVSAPRPAAATPSAAQGGTFSDGTPIDEAEQWEEFAAAPLPAATEPDGPQGFDAICPAHRKEYKEGRYGLFCTQPSDDPDWSNKRGYCTVTPKSAAAWLRKHAGVAA